jgi:hypothetical protein
MTLHLETLDLLVIALASWRLAYLAAKESAPFGIMTKLRQRTTLGGLLSCLYCSSWWAALVMLALWLIGAQVLVYVFAVSAAALMLGAYTGVSQG